MRVCIGEGRVRVACSLLYPIFKFGWCRGGNTTWECVFWGWDFLWGKWGGVLWICKNKCNFADGKLRDFFAHKWHKFSLTDCFSLTEFTEHTEIIYCLRNKLPFGVVFFRQNDIRTDFSLHIPRYTLWCISAEEWQTCRRYCLHWIDVCF